MNGMMQKQTKDKAMCARRWFWGVLSITKQLRARCLQTNLKLFRYWSNTGKLNLCKWKSRLFFLWLLKVGIKSAGLWTVTVAWCGRLRVWVVRPMGSWKICNKYPVRSFCWHSFSTWLNSVESILDLPWLHTWSKISVWCIQGTVQICAAPFLTRWSIKWICIKVKGALKFLQMADEWHFHSSAPV